MGGRTGPAGAVLLRLKDPCTQSVGLSQLGPGTQSYTTAPFTGPTTLAGPIGGTLYASSTTADTELVVQLSDIAPDGNATALTSELLEGNQRALEPSMTWYAPDGRTLLPYHPYPKVVQTPVVPGQVTRYEIEVFPTFDTLAPGHRLRVTIATSDFPHVLPSAVQAVGLLGGVYALRHSGRLSVERRAPVGIRRDRNRERGRPGAGLGLAAGLPVGDGRAERGHARFGDARDERPAGAGGLYSELGPRPSLHGALLRRTPSTRWVRSGLWRGSLEPCGPCTSVRPSTSVRASGT